MPVVPIPPKSSTAPSLGVGGDTAADAYARAAAKDRAETTVALDATNQLQGLKLDLSNPDTGYRSLVGGDAVKGIDGQALTGHYLSLFDQGWKDISAKLMPGPKSMFNAAALTMRDGFAKDLVRHEAEQGRVWRQQVLDTTIGNAAGALIAGTDGNDAGYAAKARAALVAGGMGLGLSGEELDKQTNFAFGRRVIEPVVTAKLGQGDVAGAKAFFDTHRDGMAGGDADILDQRLAEAGQAWDTKKAVDGLWNRLGPKSFNEPVNLDAIENDLVVRHGGDEEALIRARDEVFHRILGFTKARDETYAGYVNLLIDQVKGGASPSQIATLPQFLALPKDKQQQLSDWHREQLADRLTGFGPDQNLDRMARQFAAYHDLSGDDALKQMSVPQVQALEPVLGGDLTRQALAKKQAPTFDNIDFAALARRIGVDPNPTPSDTLGKAQLGVIRSAADKAIATSGMTLTPQQQRETAFGAAQTAIAGHPLFQLPPEVQRVLDMTPEDILGPKTSALSPEPWARSPEGAPQPVRGPAPAPQPVRPSPAPSEPSLPSPSEDPVIRQAAEKAARLTQIADGWSRATNLAKDAAKAGAKWLVRRAPVIGTIAGLAAPNEIGSEVSTYLFGRNASDTNLRLSGRSDDLSRVVQIRRQGLFGPIWETIARTEPDKGGHGGYRIVDRAAFAKKTGLDWDTIVLQSTGGKPGDKVGFGVAVNNDEERAILNDGIANRDSATNIQRRIDASRAGQGGQATISRQKATHKLFSNQFPDDEVGAPIQIYDISRLRSPTQNGGRYNYVVTSEGKLIIGRRDNTRVGGGTLIWRTESRCSLVAKSRLLEDRSNTSTIHRGTIFLKEKVRRMQR